jgi:hypothetical protein
LAEPAQGALQQAATDPTTGVIDMDKILTGTSASERAARAQLAQELTALLLRARPPTPPRPRCLPPGCSMRRRP